MTSTRTERSHRRWRVGASARPRQDPAGPGPWCRSLGPVCWRSTAHRATLARMSLPNRAYDDVGHRVRPEVLRIDLALGSRHRGGQDRVVDANVMSRVLSPVLLFGVIDALPGYQLGLEAQVRA